LLEGDGWVNWSGLATLVFACGKELTIGVCLRAIVAGLDRVVSAAEERQISWFPSHTLSRQPRFLASNFGDLLKLPRSFTLSPCRTAELQDPRFHVGYQGIHPRTGA